MATSSKTSPRTCGICDSDCAVDSHLVDGTIEWLAPARNHPHGIIRLRGT